MVVVRGGDFLNRDANFNIPIEFSMERGGLKGLKKPAPQNPTKVGVLKVVASLGDKLWPDITEGRGKGFTVPSSVEWSRRQGILTQET